MTAAMAAAATSRSLFTLTRSAIPFKSIFRALSSISTATPDAATSAADLAPSPVPGGSVDELKKQLFRLRLPKRSATNLLQKWVDDGNPLTLPDLRRLAKDLNRAQRYKHALEISEWMVINSKFALTDHDYAIRIDLITKVFGTNFAEEFFGGIPSSAKTIETYTALLHSFACAKLVEKAEQLLDQMKEMNLPLNALAFNEMMTLYMSVSQFDKIPMVVEELKKNSIPLDLFTYNLWVSASAAALDFEQVERIIQEMSCDSTGNDGWETYINLSRVYLSSACLMTSNDAPVEAAKKVTQREWITYDFLIFLYASLANKQKVADIWKSLRMSVSTLGSRSFMSLLSSYIINGHMEEAEVCFDEWKKSAQNFDLLAVKRVFNAFLKIGLSEEADLLQLVHKKGCETAD